MFSGKKILLLGGKPIGAVDITKYAKSKGAYVIVTDYLSKEQSPAKQIADESWSMSTGDVDLLLQKIQEKNVDAVISGVHEYNYAKSKELCEKLGKPFFATTEQWNISTNKAVFKQLCKEYQLPTAKSYSIYDTDINFPIIVKPVDGNAGQGISICYNREQLDMAYDEAMSVSIVKDVIIEEYLYGEEIVVFYTIIDGVSKLSVMTDYYYNYDQEKTMPLPQVYMYPSQYLDEYMDTMNDKVKKMLKGIGVQNGTFFLQAFKNKDGFFFFEPGFRPGGSSVCKYTKLLNGISYMDMLVNFAFTGKMLDDINKENPYFKRPCCTYSVNVKGGIIGDIKGYENIIKLPVVIDSEKRYNIGDEVPKMSALRQIVLRFFIVADTYEEIRRTITTIQTEVDILDTEGNSMLIPNFDISRLDCYNDC